MSAAPRAPTAPLALCQPRRPGATATRRVSGQMLTLPTAVKQIALRFVASHFKRCNPAVGWVASREKWRKLTAAELQRGHQLGIRPGWRWKATCPLERLALTPIIPALDHESSQTVEACPPRLHEALGDIYTQTIQQRRGPESFCKKQEVSAASTKPTLI